MSIITAFLVGSIDALVLGIIIGWYITRQRELDERMEKSRKETKDLQKEIYKRSLGYVNISQIHEGKFYYEGKNFSVEVNNAKLIYTDKETGNKIIKEL